MYYMVTTRSLLPTLLLTMAINMYDQEILHDLSHLQFDFFRAVREGPEATVDFAIRFASLEEVFLEQDKDSDEKDYETRLANAHEAAFTISTVASSLHEMSEFADQLTTELSSNIEHLFTTLSLDNSRTDELRCHKVSNFEDTELILTNSTSTQSSSSNASKGNIDEHSPYQLTSCQWLLDNIHNPYPPAATKLKIARDSGVSHKLVSEWFSQSRRRIGWTSFLKKRFNGNRQLCVDSAQRVLVDGIGPSSYEKRIIDDLISIKRKAERLYRGRAGCSDLAKKLERTHPAVTLESKNLKSRKRQRVLDDDTEPCHERPDASGCHTTSVQRPLKRRKYVLL